MLGLCRGRIWTRQGRCRDAAWQATLTGKESARWIATADQAKQSLSGAAMVTVVADRESDFYAHWAPARRGGNVHLLTRL